MFATIRHCFILISALIGSAASVAHAAGIDCSKANSAVEKLICSDRWLGNTDEEMSVIYDSLLSESSKIVAQEFRRSQRLWIANVRDKCTDISCLIGAYQDRRWELAQQLKDFDCSEYARTTIEMDGCGRARLDDLDRRMQSTVQELLEALESEDCCGSSDPALARKLAIESQNHWLKFRDAECSGHYETISAGTLRGSFYLGCAMSLTEERIKQLSHWGTVNLDERKRADVVNDPRRAIRVTPK